MNGALAEADWPFELFEGVHWCIFLVFLTLLASLPEDEQDPVEPNFITADSQHFWPYGLDYASEHKSEWSLINHVRIVNAMNLDK